MVQSAAFLILLFTVPLVSWRILIVAGIRPLNVSIPMVFVWSYLAFAFVGLLPLYFQWIPYRAISNRVNDPDLVLEVFLLSSSNLLLFCLGILVAHKTKSGTARRQAAAGSGGVLGDSTAYYRLAVWAVFALCVVVIADYLSRVPSIAIVAAFVPTDESVSEIRSAMTAEFSGRLHWYRLFYSDILSFLTYLTFSEVLAGGHRRVRFRFAVVFAVAVFGLSMTGQKAPVGWLLIGLALTWAVARGRARIRLRVIVPLAIGIMGLVSVLYILFNFTQSPGRAVATAASRAFTGQITPAYHYLRMFPVHEDYLLGRSFPNPRGILPYEVYPLTRRVMEFFHPSLARRGIVGTAPTVFWAEIYANFGYVAAALVGLPLGVLVGLIDRLLARCVQRPESVAFYVWTALYFRNLTGTGLSTVVVPISFVVVFMLWRGFAGAPGFHRSRLAA